MKRARRYGARATGFLSALVLYLAAALAGAYGPLTTEASSASSTSRTATGGMGSRDQQSAPASHKRPSVSFENREPDSAAPQDGGAKAGLPPAGLSLPEALGDNRDETFVSWTRPSLASHHYGARAPPALS